MSKPEDSGLGVNRRDFLAASGGLSVLAGAAVAVPTIANSAPQSGGTLPPEAPASVVAATEGKPGWQFGPYEDLREYIRDLEKRGLVLKVRDIDQDKFELTALVYRLIDKFGTYEAPTVFAENVKIDGVWHKGPIIANHYGHWDSECLTYGVEPVVGDGKATYRRALKRIQSMLNDKGQFDTAPYELVAREKAPCKEVVLTGDAVDLTKFAFIESNPGDSARYVNTGSVFTYDDELGKNFGTYRCQINGPRVLGVNPEPGQGGWKMLMEKKKRGEKSAHVTIALGQDPMTWVVSSAKLNRGGADELELVSGMRGKPLKVVKSETNDIIIPANAEIVIEGIVPLDQMLPEGPFGEMYGYMGRAKTENFFMNVTCITHRKNPWVVNSFTGTGRGFPTGAMEQLAMNTFRRFVPNLVMIHSPVGITGNTFISIKKQKAGEGLDVGKRVADVVGIAKIVVVVDDDVDVLDEHAVWHAVGSRWQPKTASVIIDEARGMPLDPSLINPPTTSKIVIDATRQWPEEGGPKDYQPLNRTQLIELAPDAFPRVDAKWSKLVGKYRPPGR